VTGRGRRRRWVRWVVGGVVVLAVLAVAVPFVYIHFVEGPAPAPLKLSPATSKASASTPTSTTSVAGTFTVGKGSVAGYRVQEVLFGQSNTAVGRTTSVTGGIVISGDAVTSGRFTVNLTDVRSDQSQRDVQFQGRIMDTGKYPTATFTLSEPIPLGTTTVGTVVTRSATGTLRMHGTTRPVTLPVHARYDGSTIQVSGSIPVVFTDWGIPNPSFGPITTQDHGTVEFLLTLAPTAR
jgi:polyisoprenoid-binding protein YceI